MNAELQKKKMNLQNSNFLGRKLLCNNSTSMTAIGCCSGVELLIIMLLCQPTRTSMSVIANCKNKFVSSPKNVSTFIFPGTQSQHQTPPHRFAVLFFFLSMQNYTPHNAYRIKIFKIISLSQMLLISILETKKNTCYTNIAIPILPLPVYFQKYF